LGKRQDQCCGLVPLRHIADILAGTAHPHTVDAEAVLGLVVIEGRNREEAALLVLDHVSQQSAADFSGSEHDDTLFVAFVDSVTTAPGADQEARCEHAHQCEGTGDHRDAAGDHHWVGPQDPGK
jgi:hypothetical protein